MSRVEQEQPVGVPALPLTADGGVEAGAGRRHETVLPIPPLPSRATAPAIRTRGLTKIYGQLVALDHLDLELESGDVFGFIGPNGAGKSTTMKILAGLLQPTHGSAEVLGRDVTRNGDFVRRNVGYMPDFFGSYEDLTVSEYLEFFAAAYGIPRRQRKKVVGDVLDLTDLKYKQDALTDSLSRGMTQRLSLARVLVHDPPILLLDEPASGLDPRARIEIRELIRELQRLGKTILVSSHILSELGEFCNKLGIVERGKLIVAGTVEELMARARAHPVISVKVVGDAAIARVALEHDGRVERVESQNGELMVTLRDPSLHHGFLVEVLVARQIAVHSVAPHQLKLEDVFLRLTKGIVQ
ncbi:MAG TPA: ABC transporter ATP-binding protein [Tepidisphaeraceae bacterium]|nr:ABC transporter ATP-binding protein [Tepidisphaeraceae bacterium]